MCLWIWSSHWSELHSNAEEVTEKWRDTSCGCKQYITHSPTSSSSTHLASDTTGYFLLRSKGCQMIIPSIQTNTVDQHWSETFMGINKSINNQHTLLAQTIKIHRTILTKVLFIFKANVTIFVKLICWRACFFYTLVLERVLGRSIAMVPWVYGMESRIFTLDSFLSITATQNLTLDERTPARFLYTDCINMHAMAKSI